MIRLRLKPGREASVRRRHPWLFSGAVSSAEGDGSDGCAEVLDADGQPLAHGSYSPDSQIVARLWTFDGRLPDAGLFRERFEAARSLRERVLSEETTGFRAVNSEGDLCPGVLLDIYGDVAVLELVTEGTENWEPDLTRAAHDVFSPGEILVRKTGADRDSRSGPQSKIQDRKSKIEPVPFTENGLRFFADIPGGQKTGFFLDQRDNRIRLRALAAGRTVLNLFSYTGAFSVAALAGGAARAVDVDSSEAALDLSRQHRRANGFPAGDRDFVRADVFEDLRSRVEAGETWGIVVCDPPAFAWKRGDVPRAARGYKDINRLAMELVEPGGWLLTCSCSGQISPDLFQKIVFSASLDAGRSFSLAARQGAGADHPVSLDCPEGEYLKGLWLSREI
ncbi:MAG TPA: class I SAM-dependent rRNA methyltransferase [Thermoanaerobaculia bacterium]